MPFRYPGTWVPVPVCVPGYPRTRTLVLQRAVLLQLEHPSPGVLPGYPPGTQVSPVPVPVSASE
eukprot:3933100-Rhodomonas_salina.1